jgi:hypothetical protein
MRDDVLAGLAAPPPRPGFHDALWDRAVAAERASARRWRRTSIALAAVTIAAIAAASAFAAGLGTDARASVIDRTLSCATSLQAQRPVMWVQANVKTKRNPVASLDVITLPATTWVVTGQKQQMSIGAAKDGFGIDDGSCTASKQRVPLVPSGLPASTTVTSTFLGSFWETCRTADHNRADRTLLHVHVTLKNGIPATAQLAIRNEATGKPVGYVEWTPKRVASWFGPACNAYH